MSRRAWMHGVGVAVLLAPVAGVSCGGRISGETGDDGGLALGQGVVEDAGNTNVGPGKKDAQSFPPPGFEGGTSGSGSGSSGACPGDVSASDIPTYVGPNVAFGLGSCTQADLNALSASVNNTTSTPDDWYKAISASCQKCVFSGQSDSTWAVIVLSPDLQTGLAAGANAQGFLNVGPCFQEAAGGSAACGKGAEDFNNCVEAACPSPTCDSDQACENTASDGVCAKYTQEYMTGCGAALTALNTTCYGNGNDTIDALVQAVCGPTSAIDGGAD